MSAGDLRRDLTDEQFALAFERCEIPKEDFHHRDHVRLARFYIARYGVSGAEERIATGIRRYAAHLGISQKYHHTITIAWVRLVAYTTDSEAVLDPKYLAQFYSDQLLASADARNAFVSPNKRPLPGDAQTAPGVVK
jgi:hypothetical protein